MAHIFVGYGDGGAGDPVGRYEKRGGLDISFKMAKFKKIPTRQVKQVV
jgi:hypothetical protein